MSGSTLPVGSSATSSSGRPMTARAIAIRCCSPPDSVGGLASARPSEPDPGQHLAHRRRDLALGHARHPQRQRDIVVGAQVREQAEILEHHPDPAAEARQALARERHRILAEQAGSAAGRALRQIQQLQQRGLARPRCPGQEIERARLERERHVAQRLRAGAVAQPHILELHDIGHAGRGRNRAAARLKHRRETHRKTI